MAKLKIIFLDGKKAKIKIDHILIALALVSLVSCIIINSKIVYASGSQSENLTTGLVAYWDFEGATNLTDVVSGHVLYSNRSSAGATYPKFNSTGGQNGTGGYYFAGDESSNGGFLSADDHVDFELTYNYTVSIWFLTDSTSSDQWSTLIEKAEADYETEYGLQFTTTSNDIRFATRQGGTGRNTNSYDIGSGTWQWHHLVAVKITNASGSTIKLYVNGTLFHESLQVAFGQDDNSAPLLLMRQKSGRFSRGYIDNVGIWKGVGLNSSQIEELYSLGSDFNATYVASSVNNTPTFNESLTAQTFTNNTAYEYNINCSDSDGDAVFYFDNTSYFNITYLNGSIYYTPDGAFNETINITCGDENSNVSETFDLEVVGTSVASTASTSDSLVVNLTFDNFTGWLNDTSSQAHTFNNLSGAGWANATYCKYQGCVNLSIDGDDYLNSSTKFAVDNGMSMCWWAYSIIDDDTYDSNSQFHHTIGTGTGHKGIYENQYGINLRWEANLGRIDPLIGASWTSRENTWEHYCMIYDNITALMYKNGDLKKNSSEALGNLNYTVGEVIKIGYALTGDWRGYMDEILIYNSSINSTKVTEIYQEKVLGTPPDLDIYVKNITYILPIDYTNLTNKLERSGTMQINITIANAGSTDSTAFDYNVTVAGAKLCNGEITLLADTEMQATCNWTISYGFHEGNVSLDTTNTQTEDLESNNGQKIYIPYLDRPFTLFNLTQWNDDIRPYCDNASNSVAYASCQMIGAFTAEDFNTGWDGNDVDPRGKKGRELAMSCMWNNYTPSTVCSRARNHLFGWANRTVSGYSNVQEIHELFQVAMIYDVMFPNLTQSENELVTAQFHDICQQITNLDNTRPDNDDDDQITGGNGQGFGSGMGGFCTALVGSFQDNPTFIQQIDDKYYGANIPDEWMDREKRFIRAFKNDSWSQYQEAWLYKTYSQFHLVENWYMEDRLNLNSLENYDNALCGMAREVLTMALDHSYSGKALRNDEDNTFRWVQRGDTNSYQHVADNTFADWDIITYYGLLCSDTDTKNAILWMRDLADTLGEDAYEIYLASYLYPELAGQGTSTSPEGVFPKVIYDNNNDILLIRSNYTYENDTVIQIDGGEEKGGGHSQAQGYFLYANGEPFLDYEQVPYNDDTRMDAWKNGISILNTTQTEEGQSGHYLDELDEHGYNQFYGGGNTLYYSTNYPDGRYSPINYTGDLEDYVGTDNADFSGVFVWRPMYNLSDPLQEYFIKYGDLLVKRTKVIGNTNNQIYHNFINIHDEFDETANGNNITYNRSRNGVNYLLDINEIWSNQTLAIGGGNTTIQACLAKTTCTGSSMSNSSYRRTYLYSPTENIDFILAHHWYSSGNQVNQTPLGDNDKGLNQSDNIILFDTDNDGSINYTSINATAWGIAYNENKNETGAFNATYIKRGSIELLSSNNTISLFIEENSQQIKVTANTMQRDSNIDKAQDINVTIDADKLVNDSTFTVKKNGADSVSSTESGTKVIFTINTEQNSDYYIITASGGDTTAPTISNVANSTTTNQSTYIDFDLNEDGNSTIKIYNNSIRNNTYLQQTVNNNTFKASWSIFIPNLQNSTEYYVNITSCDSSGNCNEDNTLIFNTSYNNASDITSPTANISTYSFDIYSAVIQYNASENANASISYGTSTEDLKTNVTNTSYQNQNNITLSSLSAGTVYFYNLTLCDSSGNCFTNGTFSFTTYDAPDSSSGGGGGGGGIACSFTGSSCAYDWQCCGELICENQVCTNSSVEIIIQEENSSVKSQNGFTDYINERITYLKESRNMELVYFYSAVAVAVIFLGTVYTTKIIKRRKKKK